MAFAGFASIQTNNTKTLNRKTNRQCKQSKQNTSDQQTIAAVVLKLAGARQNYDQLRQRPKSDEAHIAAADALVAKFVKEDAKRYGTNKNPWSAKPSWAD